MSGEVGRVRVGRLPLTERDTFAVDLVTATGSWYRIIWHAHDQRGTLMRRAAESEDHPMSGPLRRDGDVVPLLGFDRIDLEHRTTFVIDVRSDGVLTQRWANVSVRIEGIGWDLTAAVDPDDSSSNLSSGSRPVGEAGSAGVDASEPGLSLLSNGVLTNVHPPSACAGQPWGCWVHDPRPHPLAHASVRWREDKGTAERLCVHGIGHPDPQDAAYWWHTHRRDVTVHGCDGCCQPLPEWSPAADTGASSTDAPSVRPDP